MAIKTKKCPNCHKEVEILWHQIGGMLLLEKNEDDKMCYKAKCPECGFVWLIPK